MVLTPALTFYPLPQERKSPWHVFIFSADRPANPVARFSRETANDSPSPPTGVGGEGRGEVARDTNYLMAGRKDHGKRPTANARPGRGRMQSEFNAKTLPDFFYYETRKPGISEKISWFPGFLIELILVAPLHLCVESLLRGGRLQRPTTGPDSGN
jgi:hypothetical protein